MGIVKIPSFQMKKVMRKMATVKWMCIAIVHMSVLIVISCEETRESKITVALPERRPFVTVDKTKLRGGLEASIIDNFAQKFHFQVKYVHINKSFSSIFCEDNFNKDSIRNVIRYCF